MLLRFGVENHLSINDRQELSLIATKLKDQDNGLIDNPSSGDKKLLPATLIYGANASGKSNVISALQAMRSAVLFSHSKGDPESVIPYEPFALSPNTKSRPTVFDVDFILDNVRYHYGFSTTNKAFTSEWLYSFPEGTRRKLFERNDPKKVSFGGSLRGQKKVISGLMRSNSLFLSAAAQNDHEELSKISAFFRSIRFSGSISVAGAMIDDRFSEDELDSRSINFLKKIGTGVVGYRRSENDLPEEAKSLRQALNSVLMPFFNDNEMDVILETEDKSTSIELAHRDVNDNDVFFNLNRESAGTRRLLILLNTVFRALDRGSLVFIDELEASLHTQACEAVLSLFSSPTTNPKGAQLIATTHDTNLMVSKLLRRDQIWFTEKDGVGATHLYPLSDIQTRQSDNIERGYLQGRYGAIPFAGSVTDLLMTD